MSAGEFNVQRGKKISVDMGKVRGAEKAGGEIMRRYKIQWNGRQIISRGCSGMDAFERFAARPVFGRGEILHPAEYRLEQIDADTRGEKWVSYRVRDAHLVICELV